MGIIKTAGYVPGFGYISDGDIVRNMKAMPKVVSKNNSFDAKFENERTR